MLILSTLFRFDSGDFARPACPDSQTAYPTLIFSPFVPRVALIPAITSVVGNPGGRVIRRKNRSASLLIRHPDANGRTTRNCIERISPTYLQDPGG
jgi:hypothetical protein